MPKNFQLSRRLLLQGFGGLTLALPALEFTHGKAWAAPAAGVAKRFIVFFEHGGTISNTDRWGNVLSGANPGGNVVDAWRPLNDGKTQQALAGNLGAIHQPLVGSESDLLVLSGINNLAVQQQSPYQGDHHWANASALTNAKVTVQSANNYLAQGPSIDAVIAQRMAQSNPVPFPAVNLFASAHNYGTPFSQGANQPFDGESDPAAAFKNLFANVGTGTNPDPAILRARALKKSVLDGTSSGLTLYKNKLSAQDKTTIDAHLSLIRGIEQQLQQLPVPMVGCGKPTLTPPFSSANNDTIYSPILTAVGPAHIDILLASLRCGLTNVGTFNLGDFYNDWMHDPYPAAYNIGHSLDHGANDVCPGGSDAVHFPEWYKTILDNRQWRAGLFKRLIDGLKTTPEGSGTMLDNSLVLWTSEFSYGGNHSSANLPIMLAGKAGGQLRTGRHIDYRSFDPASGDAVTSATNNNLYTSCLQLCGYTDNAFGDTFSDLKSRTGLVTTQAVDGPLPGLT